MGLGKSLTTLALIAMMAGTRPVISPQATERTLIIAPLTSEDPPI